MIVRVVSAALLVLLIVSGAAAESSVNMCMAAQDFSPKPVAQSTCIGGSALQVARDSCGSMTVGQICLGAGSVRSTPGSLPLVGTALGIDMIDNLTSVGGSSLVMLKMRAGLPDTATPVQVILFGDASLDNEVVGLDASSPTLTVRNGPTNILNLRATPATDGEIVGSMQWNEELPADGRTANNSWLHVQSKNGAAWVFASLVTVDGDMTTLPVLGGFVTDPMQSVKLQTTSISCGGGLLVQGASDQKARLEVNGALLTFLTATLLMHSEAEGTLDIAVLAGAVTVDMDGRQVTGRVGTLVQAAAGATPKVQESFAFASLGSVPLTLLESGTPMCIAGVSDGTAPLYRTAGSEQSSGELDADTSRYATAQTVIDGVTWLQVGNRWVKMDDVQTVGICDALPEPSASQNTSQPADNTSSAGDLVIRGQSIWQAHTGVDNLSGVCTAPPIAQCDHLAAVSTQQDGSITWLGQEPSPYTLVPSGANTYSFSGRNQLNNANLSLTVTFTSESTWVGTMNIVYDNDSGCTHTFNYTAERIR